MNESNNFELLKQQIQMLKGYIKLLSPEQKKQFCLFVIGVMTEVMKE